MIELKHKKKPRVARQRNGAKALTRYIVGTSKKKSSKIIVNVSGGKDSTTCLIKALNDYPVNDVLPLFADTGFEHSITYKYLDYLESKLNVEIKRVKSKKYSGLIDCLKSKRIFPSGIRRFCTHELKLKPIWGFIIDNDLCDSEQWLGIRSDESNQRNKKYKSIGDHPIEMFWVNPKVPAALRNMKVRFPLLYWNEKQCFEYIRVNNIKSNPLYEFGNTRVGCYPCIISGFKSWKKCWSNKEGRKNILELMKVEKGLNGRGFETTIKPGMNRFVIERILKFDDDQYKLFDIDKGACLLCNI